MDNLTKEQRLKNMRANKAKDTKIELSIRKILWNKGYRFRKNYQHIVGKPDIVFLKKKVAIFCDGVFWHGFDWGNCKADIKTNTTYWVKKIETNIKKDEFVNQELTKNGRIVLRFWEFELKNDLLNCFLKIETVLKQR